MNLLYPLVNMFLNLLLRQSHGYGVNLDALLKLLFALLVGTNYFFDLSSLEPLWDILIVDAIVLQKLDKLLQVRIGLLAVAFQLKEVVELLLLLQKLAVEDNDIFAQVVMLSRIELESRELLLEVDGSSQFKHTIS